MSGITYTDKRFNAHCADYPMDSMSIEKSHNGRDLSLEVSDSSGYGGKVHAAFTMDMSTALALRDFLNAAYPEADAEGEQLFYVIGMNPRTLKRTPCKTEDDAIKHAEKLLARTGHLEVDDSKLGIVKVVSVVERAPPPICIRKPGKEDTE